MSPLILILAAGAVGYVLLKGGPSSKAAKVPTDAPADATSLFATIIAPSMVDTAVLGQSFAFFIAGAANQAAASAAQLRLIQYAIVAFLKGIMLTKGAQPDANELAMIGAAPFTGGAGLVSYGDAGMDQLQAVAAALAPNYMDPGGLGQYLSALKQISGSAGATRINAFALAIKVKTLLLTNPVGIPAQFPNAEKIPSAYPQCLFAIANVPKADLVAPKQNSLLNY